MLTYIDIHFGRFINRLAGSGDPDIFLAAALVSNAAGNGDVCFDLGSFAGKVISEEGQDSKPVVCPPLDLWLEKLGGAPVVGGPGDFRPLVLDGKNRLYLYRYWDYEKRLSDSIRLRAADVIEGIDTGRLKNALERLFPDSPGEKENIQRIAAVTSVFRKFCVISGGPGTGKTTTIAKIIALLTEVEAGRKLKICLCAPTGKAAARLSESIRKTKLNIDCSETVKNPAPENACTIHRLLKTVPGSSRFYYNAGNQLPADVVVVDEASMVDLALLAKLVEAVPDNARLILVGDKDQLASVEAGSALGDICNRGELPVYSAESFQALINGIEYPSVSKLSGRPILSDSIIVLQKNYRFSESGGIGRLSRAVNNGEADAFFDSLKEKTDERIIWEEIKTRNELNCALEKKIVEGYRNYLNIDDPAAALDLFGRFKILCAVNKGPFGVDAVNGFSESVLAKNGLINPSSRWYRGRPVLIKGNNYGLGLFNGDLGIISGGKNEEDLRAFFHADSGPARKFAPGILPDHDTAYAMTVHKSQGSEFEDVVLILPEKDYPVLTRELIYTGLTRTTGKIALLGTESVVRNAILRKTERASGLRDALWR